MIDPYFYTIGSPITLADLATDLGVTLPVEDARDEVITVPSALNVSRPGSLTFFSDKRRKDQLATAQATACLTTEKLLPLVTKTGMIALITDNPRAVFARFSGKIALLNLWFRYHLRKWVMDVILSPGPLLAGLVLVWLRTLRALLASRISGVL